MLDGMLMRLADGGAEIAFDRRIDKPIGKIWAALTEPAALAKWLGDVEVDLRVGGKYVIHFAK